MYPIPDFHDLNKKYRDVCWDLKKRGAVGETCLHLCLLNATSIHADLAKRLLRFYPKLINDIYMGDEYYGVYLVYFILMLRPSSTACRTNQQKTNEGTPHLCPLTACPDEIQIVRDKERKTKAQYKRLFTVESNKHTIQKSFSIM